ncbi:MAG TPA: tRNA nucleotidyltransferase [Zoogloea sp.]|uniref:tRNA nucleotidyltransferase n=1 Tax=Zoogloea sp. TaxID=49181 RepID=UPI002B906E98|nr:tRNA nucleotidyltransferase [Zoogloea sp.]HMV64959.1 tRNA nucleotidyltransferase [Rhodocyclaceae bacterium]HMW53686.1 tRNA nucleotidyltransferase [Rhodocyclaceae bacterium]HMZ77890.1 tRNA nucleotidyltransferase [Rhodocyclaceae bacterium]HNA69186.1 tRNA nucleotidyltransferase [Rhodocyclaceae bacterium]HNB66282.1 tRNA nucleotidyltransferase [Rhodocyclaceae bacterium]
MSDSLYRNPLARIVTSPGEILVRVAAAAAGPTGEVDAEMRALMARQVAAGELLDMNPAWIWPDFAAGLMRDAPSKMLWVLRETGALRYLLPELDALFGVPQSADDPPTVDIGEHQLRVVDAVARQHAPLAVRFAALLYNLGKADSPPEHLPSHYRHMERGAPRVEAVCARFGVTAEVRELALLALREVERVHRAAEMRAGSIAALLERVDAFGQPERFARLMTLCACDFHAFPGRATRPYPKARLLATALEACRGIDPAALQEDHADDPEAAAQALLEARAMAVARALRSERWDDSAQEEAAAD